MSVEGTQLRRQVKESEVLPLTDQSEQAEGPATNSELLFKCPVQSLKLL